ncbi:6-phosphogluconolactonase [Phyllobacterium endophyticum]|uniref:6-phosphogluconolactonase n=1 Tax=Phyllobacterium endophyticum TaxID=1149773 RepID=A0A2P7B117_9HYPH|nr:6-phosphogluconolactonase [Phyllobacterium endophyticum]MBB3237702.1 6-phosphogluconolactonase [Phyllobacterium endophyticum]PSH60160.1 6-phosphogluconolactonase [Phyllobacterium endophyticum]TYR42326.1 6-phosphogluconolactonase [Phyllobacterium endophyticum]
MAHNLHSFADGNALAEAFASVVAERLAAACDARGKAVLAVSGGTTPARFFKVLSLKDLPWEKITVTLVDERFVPPTSDRSNQKLVAGTLLQNKAAEAPFIGLYNEAPDAEAGAGIAAQNIAKLGQPFDVVILGMGGDGHTASFFPGGDRLSDALSTEQQALVLPIHAEAAGEPRLTLTLPAIVNARFAALHIEGAGKRTTLEKALGAGATADMPIRAILRHEPIKLEIFWAP